jgi:hypothetical protein
MDWAKLLRGAAVAAGAYLLGSAAMAANGPPLPPGAHFRAIKVDVSPVAHDVGEPTAGWLAQALPGELQAVFAGRLAPGDRSAPTLVVRIDRVFFGNSGIGLLGPAGATEAIDNIEGAGIVVGANGGTLGVYPLFNALNNYTGGVNYETGAAQSRVNSLAHSFAYWLPGQMGL